MSGLKVVDDTTFTAELAGPVSIFATIVGYSAFAPMPEIYFTDPEAFKAKPIGNGPFQFVSAKPNVDIVLTAFPDYKGPEEGAGQGPHLQDLPDPGRRVRGPAGQQPRRPRHDADDRPGR